MTEFVDHAEKLKLFVDDLIARDTVGNVFICAIGWDRKFYHGKYVAPALVPHLEDGIITNTGLYLINRMRIRTVYYTNYISFYRDAMPYFALSSAFFLSNFDRTVALSNKRFERILFGGDEAAVANTRFSIVDA